MSESNASISENVLINPSQEVVDLINRDPSGPDFVQPTIDYAEDCIDASLTKINDVLGTQFPEHSQAILAVTDAMKRVDVPSPAPDYVEEDGKRYFQTRNGKLHITNFTNSVVRKYPRIGVGKYLAPLVRIRTRQNPFEKEEECSKLPFLYNKVISLSGIDSRDPKATVLAAAYVAQESKNRLNDQSKSLLTRAVSLSALSSQMDLKPFLKDVNLRVRDIKENESYTSLALSVMQQEIQKSGLTKDQAMLLLDLAFFKTDALDDSELGTRVMTPLAQAIGQNDWQKAGELISFIEGNANDFLQPWEVRKNLESGDQAQGSYAGLTAKLFSGEEVDIPYEYSFLRPRAEKDFRKLREREKQDLTAVLKQTIDLTELFWNTIIRRPKDLGPDNVRSARIVMPISSDLDLPYVVIDYHKQDEAPEDRAKYLRRDLTRELSTLVRDDFKGKSEYENVADSFNSAWNTWVKRFTDTGNMPPEISKQEYFDAIFKKNSSSMGSDILQFFEELAEQ